MRILVDRHHADLLYSLQLLFEDRLGMELYVPVGHEWWDQGYWRFGEVFGDDRLARQYLVPDAKWREVEKGLYLTFDQCHPERPIYGVTTWRASVMDWHFAMASVQENQKGFKQFAELTKAKYVYHVGNARQHIDWSFNPLVLDTTGSARDCGPRVVQSAQEFDIERTFRFRSPLQRTRITSFVNSLPQIQESWEPFAALARMTQFETRSFGHHCPDGFLTPVAAVAEEMTRAGWAYQDKPTGDGFGHVIHAWAAIGRPLIGHARYYAGQRAEVFWQDGDTCVDLDKHSLHEAAEIIAGTSRERHKEMCETIRGIFDLYYNPYTDATNVRDLLLEESSLLPQFA